MTSKSFTRRYEGTLKRSPARWICAGGLTVLAAASCAAPAVEYADGRQAEAAAAGMTSSGGSSGVGGMASTAGGTATAGGQASGGTNIGAGGTTSSAGTTSSGGGGTELGGSTSGGAPSGGTAGTANTAGKSGGGAAGAGGTKCVAEVCNGLDDDCDHVIDNGCPSTFQRGAATPGTALGDSTGGGPYSETCANDEMLVGMEVAFSNWLDQVNGKCQKFSLAIDKSAVPYKYSVTFGASRLLNPNPATTSDAIQALNCPSGKVLVGLSVAEQHTSPSFTPDYIVLTRVSATCADVVVDLVTSTLKWKNTANIGPLSSSFYDGTAATAKSVALTSSQFAVGYQGSSGLWVDRVGPVVSTVQVILQ